jgi:hypothetical protein
MYGLIRRADSVLVAFVETPDGYDLAEFDAIAVAGDPARLSWNGAQFTQRNLTAAEQSRVEIEADQLWAQLDTATPQAIQSWLTANVTDLASARRVLRFILLALKLLRSSRQL